MKKTNKKNSIYDNRLEELPPRTRKYRRRLSAYAFVWDGNFKTITSMFRVFKTHLSGFSTTHNLYYDLTNNHLYIAERVGEISWNGETRDWTRLHTGKVIVIERNGDISVKNSWASFEREYKPCINLTEDEKEEKAKK